MPPRCRELALQPRLAIFQRRVKSVTREMAHTLYRTTRSPLFNNGDFAVGFLDAHGRMLEQDEHLPLMAFSLFPGCQHLIQAFGDDIHEGDVFIHNDVWHANLQLPDVAFYKPIFFRGRRIAWAACRGHWADIGGAARGTCNPDAVEVYQEALRIPPVKIWERGALRRDVWELIFANVRMREMVEADAHAQLGTCIVGERRLLELIDREGPAAFEENVEGLFAVTEQLVRAEIGRLPAGTYHGDTVVYHDTPAGVSRSKISVDVHVGTGAIAFDFSGTDPQTPTFVNASYTASAAATLVSLLYLLSQDLVHNDGMLRPVTITIPEGTILNARFPAATFMSTKLCQHICEAIMLALADAVPDRVTAPWSRRLSYRISGEDPRTHRPFHDVFFLTYEGGGATAGVDGYNQPGLLAGGNVLSQDYEVFEIQNPLYLLEHEYVQDSGGAGRWRGGLGTRTAVRYYGTQMSAAIHGDGTIEPPAGLFGGLPGTVNRIEMEFPDGRRYKPHALEIVPAIPPGTVSIHHGGGGGGYGRPTERDPAAVLADVRNGFVSRRAAEDIYGVVLTPDGRAVDTHATARRRAELDRRPQRRAPRSV
jgi:N-methylhydantoinase B